MSTPKPRSKIHPHDRQGFLLCGAALRGNSGPHATPMADSPKQIAPLRRHPCHLQNSPHPCAKPLKNFRRLISTLWASAASNSSRPCQRLPRPSWQLACGSPPVRTDVYCTMILTIYSTKKRLNMRFFTISTVPSLTSSKRTSTSSSRSV